MRRRHDEEDEGEGRGMGEKRLIVYTTDARRERNPKANKVGDARIRTTMELSDKNEQTFLSFH